MWKQEIWGQIFPETPEDAEIPQRGEEGVFEAAIPDFRRNLRTYTAAMKSFEKALVKRGVPPEEIAKRMAALRKANRPDIIKDFTRQVLMDPKSLKRNLMPSRLAKMTIGAEAARSARENLGKPMDEWGNPLSNKDSMAYKLADWLWGDEYD